MRKQKIETWITWELRDEHGQLKSYSKQRANSLVQHFINLIYCNWAAATLASQLDTSGVSQTMINTNNTVAGPANVSTYGLVVGRGTNAVTIADTQLQLQCTHGTGLNQLSHGATSFTAPTTVSTTRSFTIQRVFTNNSGNPITVNEIGIYVNNNALKFMAERALSTKTINNGTSGTLTYTIQVSV